MDAAREAGISAFVTTVKGEITHIIRWVHPRMHHLLMGYRWKEFIGEEECAAYLRWLADMEGPDSCNYFTYGPSGRGTVVPCPFHSASGR